MSEERVFFKSESLNIEGLLEDVPGDKGVVITHPHPLYGGDMDNNVVDAVRLAFKEIGYSTLRFNFRGVGYSEGSHDNGIGEQHDVSAAIQYLTDLGKMSITLAGYSFGAWVCALGIDTFDQVERLIMVSPPVSFLDYDFLKYNPKIELVIAGTEDDIGTYKKIEQMMLKWNPKARLKVIEGADHFYWGKTDAIQAIIGEFLDGK